MRTIHAVVPGPPVAQGRPRFSRYSGGRELVRPRAIDPAKSRAWKERASQEFMVAVARAYLARPAFLEPVELTIVAVFPCPRSERRKRKPAQRRPHALWPDADNVGKAVMDAGKGVLWQDDGQVARLVVEKLYGAQDEEPRVEVLVRPLLAAG